jgi:ribosomal protein L14
MNLTADQTMLNCIDNSGAAIVECAMVVGQKRHASIGMYKEPAQLEVSLGC